MARVYHKGGRVKQAVTLLEHLVAVREKMLVEEHPDRLTSQDKLARAYGADEQIQMAMELIRHVIILVVKG